MNDRRTKHVTTPQDRLDTMKFALVELERERGDKLTPEQRARAEGMRRHIADMERAIQGDGE